MHGYIVISVLGYVVHTLTETVLNHVNKSTCIIDKNISAPAPAPAFILIAPAPAPAFILIAPAPAFIASLTGVRT